MHQTMGENIHKITSYPTNCQHGQCMINEWI